MSPYFFPNIIDFWKHTVIGDKWVTIVHRKPTLQYGKIFISDEIIVWMKVYCARQGRTGPFCPEMGSTETWTTVPTSFLENSWVWWPTWHLHNFLLFFLNQWPHLDHSGLCRNQRSPQLVQQQNQSAHRASQQQNRTHSQSQETP